MDAEELLERYAKGERNFQKAMLSGVNLAGADLSEIDLQKADLTGADLSDANLTKAKIYSANLTRADLTDLSGATVKNANFDNAKLRGINLSQVDLSGFNLADIDLSVANLEKANLSQTCLQGANLERASLRQANLSEANLNKANLIKADLTDANIDGTSVEDADLSGAIMPDGKRNKQANSDKTIYKPEVSDRESPKQKVLLEKEISMNRQVIRTDAAPAPVGPYNQAIVASGQMVFVAGQIAIDPRVGHVVYTDDVAKQTECVMSNLEAILKAAGTNWSNVVKTTVFLSDMNNFAAMNAVYAKYFEEANAPARACVEVSRLPKDVLVEIDCIAVI